MTLQEVTPSTKRRRSLSPAQNPHELLINLWQRHQSEPRELFINRFVAAVLSNEDCNAVVIKQWAQLKLGTLTAPPHKPLPIASEAEKIKTKVNALINAKAKLILLDLLMPNGKPLRNCTGKECAKAGGWFTKIAGRMKPSEIVGKVWSEPQVRKLYANG